MHADLGQWNLETQLESLRSAGLLRGLKQVDSPQGPEVQIAGKQLINFSSNDYLGLANSDALKHAAHQAIEANGAGSGAARLICGSLAIHHELERALAEFKGTEAALVFHSGYACALGTISALVGPGDVVILDKLVHASIVDGARLSGAKIRVYPHNNVQRLEELLSWANGLPARGRVLIVTESVFSMEGDLARLREIVELKTRAGAWLMVDEAHATGIFGAGRRGLAEAFEIQEGVDVQMGTLGKALGSSGGYIAGSRVLIDFLVNKARSFIFSTAPVPAASAAARAAIRLVRSQDGENLRTTLWANVDHMKNVITRAGWSLSPVQSPIIPLMVGPEEDAVNLAASLYNAGFFVPAIRYPTVPKAKARLRLTVTAAHRREQIEALGLALRANT